jgi:hypothetical protein
MERIEAARELSKRVTEADLYVYVKDYLAKYWSGHRFVQEGSDQHLVNIQLPAKLAAALDDFLRSEGLLGKTLLASGEARMCRFRNRVSESPRRGEEIIHQFHPLVRFISKDLRDRNEHFYPLVAVEVPSLETSGDIRPGVYAFYVRSWAFGGVRDEEVLAVSVLHLATAEELSEDKADQVVQLARVKGLEWAGAGSMIDAKLVKDRLEQAEAALDERYRLAKERKQNENADRARFQLDSIDQHLQRRLPKLREILLAHTAQGRTSLAKATQGQSDKLQARMGTRRERIREQQKVTAERRFVCCGVVTIQ